MSNRRYRTTAITVPNAAPILVLPIRGHGNLRIQNTGTVRLYLAYNNDATTAPTISTTGGDAFIEPGVVEYMDSDQALWMQAASGTGYVVTMES